MKKKVVTAAALLFCLMLPSFAFAASEAASGSSSIMHSPIVPELGEFIPMLVAFLVVVVVLGKFGWPMIIKMLDQRAETIENSLKTAEETKQESMNILDEYKNKLAQAHKEAAGIIEAARKQGEESRAEIIARANSEADAIIEHAHSAVEAERKSVEGEMRTQTADIAIAIAAKIISANLSEHKNTELIDQYFAEMGSFNDN
ncbi:MAG: F0F1 ATP synthase subunit B [Coriobacteriia bacterium]|nr:F0F1 ATP synthase subunit B [Coriobacteriia bacterium]